MNHETLVWSRGPGTKYYRMLWEFPLLMLKISPKSFCYICDFFITDCLGNVQNWNCLERYLIFMRIDEFYENWWINVDCSFHYLRLNNNLMNNILFAFLVILWNHCLFGVDVLNGSILESFIGNPSFNHTMNVGLFWYSSIHQKSKNNGVFIEKFKYLTRYNFLLTNDHWRIKATTWHVTWLYISYFHFNCNQFLLAF